MEWLNERLEMTRERLLEGIILTAAAIVLAFGLVILYGEVANAQEVTTGRGVVCDTIEQVKYFVGVETPNAVAATNTHYGTPTVCAEGVISFIPGKEMDTVMSPKGQVVHIVKILWVGYHNKTGYVDIKPMVQYTPFMDEEKGASLPRILIGDGA